MVSAAASIQIGPRRRFRVGSVLSKTFGAYFYHFFSFTFSTFIVFLPIIIGITIFNMTGVFRSGYFFIQGVDRMIATQLFLGTLLSIFIITSVLFPINAAIIFNTTFQRRRNGRTKIISSVKIGFARGFWVILSGITGAFAITVVTIFMVYVSRFAVTVIENVSDFVFPELYDNIYLQVLYSLYISAPALILFTMWVTALPASVVEDLGPIRSLGRSQRLTKGNRWRIFIILFLAILFVAAILIAYTTVLFNIDPNSDTERYIGLFIFSALFITLTAFMFVVPGVIYHDLRLAKENVDIQKLATIFD
jgi:hypothetical protein